MERVHRRILDRWRRLHWRGWWGDYVDARFELGRRAGLLQDETVLDLGCGPGILLAEVPVTCRRLGVDLSRERLALARKQVPGALLVCADMACLPFRGGVFDTVLMGGVYEILPDKRLFLAEVSRTLIDGGQILATTPNGQHWQFWYNVHVHTAEGVEAAFTGFTRACVEGYNPMPSLDWLLPRALLRHVPGRWPRFFYIPTRLLASIPGLTRLFRRLMPVAALRRRSKFLFVTARK